MKNKLVCITIALCIILSSTITSFGAIQDIQYFYGTNTTQKVSAYSILNDIKTAINNIYNEFHNWNGTTGSGSLNMTWKQFAYYFDSFLTAGDGVISYSWEQVAEELCNDGQVNPTNLTIKEILYVVSNFIVETFSSGGDMWEMTSDIATFTISNNNLLGQIKDSNYTGLVKTPSYLTLINNRYPFGVFDIDYSSPFDSQDENLTYYYGSNRNEIDSKLDVANLYLLNNNSMLYNSSKLLLKDFNSTLSIWDSQGDSLSQSYWTPTSAFNGLYKYLAYTQRDVARLAHVIASDDEITARDLAHDNQESVTDEFINPNGQGSVSVGNIEDLSDMSGSLKDNFDTGVSPSGIWAVFNNDKYNWFTSETRNMIEPQTRGANDYPTPLLDSYYNELFGILGLEND